MDFSKILAKRILIEADKQNLSIKRLADKVNIPKSTVHNLIEGSRGNPTLSTLVYIAVSLGMSVSELLDFPEMNQLTLADLELMKKKKNEK